MKREKLTLQERVQANRESLAKQDAWAYSVSKKAVFIQPVLEEHSYGSGKRETFDVIRKDQCGSHKLPVIIYIHGGGWIAGHKETRRLYCTKLAENGFLVVNIEYDLAPEAKFPVAIGQCAAAVDCFLDVAEQYNADTDKIAVAGESAGVYYASFLAAISKDQSVLTSLGLPCMRHSEFDVKAMFSNCGAIDLKHIFDGSFPDADLFVEAYSGFSAEDIRSGKYDEAFLQMNTLSYINRSFPQTLLMYGSWDSLRDNTFIMQKCFDELGVPYTLYKNTGIFYGQHTSNMIFLFEKKANRILSDVVKFLRNALDVSIE